MEMEGDCSINRLWEWKGAVWVTNWQPLMETVTPQPYPFMETATAEIEADEANIL
jgi:hypothetical protein